jgi:hypothetical protein
VGDNRCRKKGREHICRVAWNAGIGMEIQPLEGILGVGLWMEGSGVGLADTLNGSWRLEY